MTQFSDLNLDPRVLQALTDAGYVTPTPIQADAIPPALEGRDILGIAQTGTGKTAAFVLPMITRLAQGRARARMPRSLVLCPTRELAAQVAENFDKYTKHLKLTKALLIGGVSFKDQDALIDRGVDVLIATPGRLLDHFERGKLLLTGVQIMVVDEADRMLDMGFIPDIERIFGLVPPSRQTFFFSATMAKEIERITKTFLKDPARVEVARQATTGENIAQGLVEFKPTRRETEAAEKRAVLRALIDGEGEACSNAIVFCNRKVDVDIVAKSLKKYGYDAEAIHGDLDQSQRTRTLDAFRDGKLRLLVASDVAARGLDIPAVSHVFNFDVPSHSEDYVHRIGRTGRAGRSGKALTISAPRDDKYLAAIEALIAKPIPRVENPLKDAPPQEVREDRPRREERRTEERGERRTRVRGPRRDDRREEAPVPAPALAEAAPTAEQPRPERAPRPERDHPERDRSDRDRRPRGEPRDERIVGMGDDAPSFILKSFAERRAG
ncbi:DEAD/DEAH box helicase [Rubellimicrobium aerolatum]|uniref:DEAD/DEAH box helicase n=1 Tax=Rubellimicrobium aerolatum TaxID=490979 RepID=A0ABW0SBT6_9RHOB|nr:DEAD/DEAH box helicase [Rubellimicrobium aerolatum]MBP1805897.1 ATP-dependent RNA helicase RhlE [Rubellimicrobium aerolatum]